MLDWQKQNGKRHHHHPVSNKSKKKKPSIPGSPQKQKQVQLRLKMCQFITQFFQRNKQATFISPQFRGKGGSSSGLVVSVIRTAGERGISVNKKI
jgi:hypothetical protein